MKTPRERMHVKYCPAERCMAVEDGKPSGECKTFDQAMDRVERDALHQMAMDFDGRISAAKFPRALGPGVLYTAREMDPYEKVDAFDPEMHEVHPSEFSDCPKCGEGVEHWHYKGTQNPVMWL
jgi:hypothetical protein